jgi:hypothetical protein
MGNFALRYKYITLRIILISDYSIIIVNMNPWQSQPALIDENFTKSIRGFPPCNVNPKRNNYFNIYRFSAKQSSDEKAFHHPYDKLSKVVKQKPCCCDSWAISVVSCLSDIYGLLNGVNPELDWSFIISCYSPKKFSKYYTCWGCNGDTIYNAIYFLYTNGTVKNTCWKKSSSELCEEPLSCTKSNIIAQDDAELYKIGESDLPGTQPDACNISPILTRDNKLTLPNGKDVSWDLALGYMKHWVRKNPVVVTFIVLDTFLANEITSQVAEDWHLNDSEKGEKGIYFPRVPRRVVGFHSAVIVGYDVSANGIPYWILRNSWGADWLPFSTELPAGYWKHAMYPTNLVGAVDISIDHLHPSLRNIPFTYKRGALGGMVSIGISNSSEKTLLNISTLKYSPYVREFEEKYPIYVWIVFMILLSIIIGKILNT